MGVQWERGRRCRTSEPETARDSLPGDDGPRGAADVDDISEHRWLGVVAAINVTRCNSGNRLRAAITAAGSVRGGLWVNGFGPPSPRVRRRWRRPGLRRRAGSEAPHPVLSAPTGPLARPAWRPSQPRARRRCAVGRGTVGPAVRPPHERRRTRIRRASPPVPSRRTWTVRGGSCRPRPGTAARPAAGNGGG